MAMSVGRLELAADFTGGKHTGMPVGISESRLDRRRDRGEVTRGQTMRRRAKDVGRQTVPVIVTGPEALLGHGGFGPPQK